VLFMFICISPCLKDSIEKIHYLQVCTLR